MTLIHELDLKILKMQKHTKNELSKSRLLKVRPLHLIHTDRQTDRQTDRDVTVRIGRIRGW